MDIIPTRAAGAPLALERQGETLIFNGRALDLSVIPDGATLDADGTDCPWIAGAVTRAGGRLRVPVIAPYAGGHLSPSLWHPDPILDPPDGPVALPAYEVP